MWNKFALKMALVCCVWVSVFTGCTFKSQTSGDPVQGVLKEYISRSFQVKGISDRQAMLNSLTGEAKTRLAAWSDEQFLQAFVDTKREFVKLTILEDKKISPTEQSITYELIYVDHGKESGDKSGGARVTNKKLCHFKNNNGKWLISEMRNIKELVEYRKEMTFPY